MKKVIISALIILITSSYSVDKESFYYDILTDTELRVNDNRKIRGDESTFWGLIGFNSYSINYDNYFGPGDDVKEEGDRIGFQFGYNKTLDTGGSLGISIFGDSANGDISDDYDMIDFDSGSIGLGLFIEGEQSGLLHRGYLQLISSSTDFDLYLSNYDAGIFVLGYQVRKKINKGAFTIIPQAGIEYRGTAIEYDNGFEDDYDGTNINVGVSASYKLHEKVLLGAGIKYYHEFGDYSSAPGISIDGEDTITANLGILFLINDKAQFEIKYTNQEAGDVSGDGIFAVLSISF